MKLSGKVALVTGAGQGMGRAIARLFVLEGAIVVAVDLNLAAAQETIAANNPEGASIARSVNVADSAAVTAVFAEATARYRPHRRRRQQCRHRLARHADRNAR